MSRYNPIRGREENRNRENLNHFPRDDSMSSNREMRRYRSTNNGQVEKTKPMPASFDLRGLSSIMKNNQKMVYFQFDWMNPIVEVNHMLDDLMRHMNNGDPSMFIGIVIDRTEDGISYRIILNNTQQMNELRDKIPNGNFSLYEKTVTAFFQRSGEHLCFDIYESENIRGVKITHVKRNLLESLDYIREGTGDKFVNVRAVMTNYYETFVDTDEPTVLSNLLSYNSGARAPFHKVEPEKTYIWEGIPLVQHVERTHVIPIDHDYAKFVTEKGFSSLYDNNGTEVFETKMTKKVSMLQTRIGEMSNEITSMKKIVENLHTMMMNQAPKNSKGKGKGSKSEPQQQQHSNDIMMNE